MNIENKLLLVYFRILLLHPIEHKPIYQIHRNTISDAGQSNGGDWGRNVDGSSLLYLPSWESYLHSCSLSQTCPKDASTHNTPQ